MNLKCPQKPVYFYSVYIQTGSHQLCIITIFAIISQKKIVTKARYKVYKDSVESIKPKVNKVTMFHLYHKVITENNMLLKGG